MRFESEGILLGLVSFPFDIDGGELYENVFEKFFQKHRESYLEKFAPKEQKLDENLYLPAAYRMFGNHGLAIVSLIDDYAFGSRMFNSSHILSQETVSQREKCKIVVVTGSSEVFLNTPNNVYLKKKAQTTFLRNTPDLSYPFIGIIRMKLDHRLLLHNGSRLTRLIKSRTEQIKDELLRKVKKNDAFDNHLDSIVVDSYDNDELLVMAFSNSIQLLDECLRKIRRISCQELPELEWAGEDVKHACASCHVSYGYHINFSFTTPNDIFLPWNKEADEDFFVNCLIETKPGHGKEFYKSLARLKYNSQTEACKKHAFNIIGDIPNRTMTGGSIIHVQIPIVDVENLQWWAKRHNSYSFFNVHVRRIKLTLGVKGRIWDTDTKNHYQSMCQDDLIDAKTVLDVKNKLAILGVSKIVRERLMALFDLYNDCGGNKLQAYYFEQMKDVVQNIKEVLDNFIHDEKESLVDIEKELTEEINALETAFYNRMNNKMTPNTVLEYGGGIQQFLQAFGFAHKELVRVISPKEYSKQYSLITGVSKESSVRTHTELNINHIIYPQLFSVTSWKEASNYTISIMDTFIISQEDVVKHSKAYPLKISMNMFKQLIQDNKALGEEAVAILNMSNIDQSNAMYSTFFSLISNGLLKYSFHDYLLYHFVFQRDFAMMWKYYLKIFLQTSSVYARRGTVKKNAFVFILLRLFIVAFREGDEDRKRKIHDFINKSTTHPFDFLLTKLWIESFSIVKDVAESMCKKLQSYNYTTVSEEIIMLIEYEILFGKEARTDYLSNQIKELMSSKKELTNSQILNSVLKARSENIEQLCDAIENYSMDVSLFMSNNVHSPDNVVCLLSAFLKCVDKLDYEERDDDVIITLPRDEEGKIDEALLRDILPNACNILADPTGGFMIPDHDVRKRYFAYRTVLYRTLWDLSYQSVMTGNLS